jgi:hypothetical protein
VIRGGTHNKQQQLGDGADGNNNSNNTQTLQTQQRALRTLQDNNNRSSLVSCAGRRTVYRFGGMGEGGVRVWRALSGEAYKAISLVHNIPFPRREGSAFLRLEKTTLSIEITPTAPAELSRSRSCVAIIRSCRQQRSVRKQETQKPFSVHGPPGVLEHRQLGSNGNYSTPATRAPCRSVVLYEPLRYVLFKIRHCESFSFLTPVPPSFHILFTSTVYRLRLPPALSFTATLRVVSCVDRVGEKSRFISRFGCYHRCVTGGHLL